MPLLTFFKQGLNRLEKTFVVHKLAILDDLQMQLCVFFLFCREFMWSFCTEQVVFIIVFSVFVFRAQFS